MSVVFTGRCLCGAVTYQCGPPVLTPCFCHCESCRRASGSHVVAWATVEQSTFKFNTGPVRSFVSSPPVLRQFCERCGTALTYSHEQWPATIDIAMATLDTPDSMQPPGEHIWMEDALGWDRPNDGLPRFERSR